MLIKRSLILLVLISFFAACSTTEPLVEQTFQKGQHPKNIILMIGDGMGLAQISAAMYYNRNKLHFEEFEYIGFHKSYAADNLITDSAAGASAFACGKKTFNGAIGIGVDTLPMLNIIEEAESKGYATGLVATSTIVHATPAAFIAHENSRESYEAIAVDFLDVDIDLFIGGGKRYFDNRETDDRDLIQELKRKGYLVGDYFNEDIVGAKPSLNRNFAFFTADKQPLPAQAGRDYLPYASKLAVNFLKNRSDKGFFLMIEGSQIDWGGHGNDGQMVIQEVLDFNKALGKVLDFAKKDGNTLVIVTADHETGGLALNPGSRMGKIKTAFTTNGHTAAMVPVFAYGPSAEKFTGIFDNTEIYHKMRAAFGFKEVDLSSISVSILKED